MVDVTVHIAATQGTVAMCDEIKDPRVLSTLRYIIRQYDYDNNTVEVHFPKGGQCQVSYFNIQQNLAEKLDGKITENSDLVLNFYVNSDDQIIENTKITIKECETKYWIGELA